MSSVSALVPVAFPLPDWATSGVKRKKYGKAKTLGADAQTLSDEDLTEGFLEAQSAGKPPKSNIFIT